MKTTLIHRLLAFGLSGFLLVGMAPMAFSNNSGPARSPSDTGGGLDNNWESERFDTASLVVTGFGFSQPARQLKETLELTFQALSRASLDAGARRQSLHAIISRRFDYWQMAKHSLGPHWEHLTPRQKERFADVFSRLLEKSYINLIKDFRGGTVHYLSEKVRDKYAAINTRIYHEGRSIDLNYKLVDKDGIWRVYDLRVEGVSMVRNYRAQFSRWLRSQSVDRLLNRLQQQAT